MENIKILVVDDQDADSIKENIEDFIFQETNCDIETARSIEEADIKIKEKNADKRFFDIMIIDMNLKQNNHHNLEGLEILERNFSCIKLVLTSNKSFKNCVECLRKGAFDYIIKNSTEYDPYVRLKESMRQALDERLMEKEMPFLSWVSKQHLWLSREYGGQWIAVIDEIVVEADKDYDLMKKRVKEKYPFFRPDTINIPEVEL